MSAIIREDLFTAEFLIENSCNLNQINNINGESVLHGMCSIKDRTIRNDIMTIAKKILSRPNVDSNIRNHHGFAPLHIAISCGFTEMIDELMQICDINLETLDGKCCLELALTLDNFDVAAKLVEKGANPNIEMRSGDSLINHMIKVRKKHFPNLNLILTLLFLFTSPTMKTQLFFSASSSIFNIKIQTVKRASTLLLKRIIQN